MGKIRGLSSKIDEMLRIFPVVALIGPRQCGKSTLVKDLHPDWKYYDLESPDDYQLITSDPVAFFRLHSESLIIDEAQQYPDLFKVLRGVIDSDRKKKGRFLLTGSSSPEIIKGLTESLAGRISTIEMWPFKGSEYYEKKLPTFYEMLTSKNVVIEDFKSLKPEVSLRESMNIWFKGGFPEPLIESEQNENYHRFWMENYISNYINRDVRGLFPKLNIHNFRRFLTLLAQFSGHQLNMSDIGRALEVTVPTVKDYLDIVHQTFIWRNLSPFEKNSLKKIQKSNKGFFRDQGLLHHFLKIQSSDDLLIHPVAGFSFESFVIEEIVRGLQCTGETQLEFFYYRTVDKSEVDLVIDAPFGIIPVEIKLGSTVKKQALRGLNNLISDLNLEFGLLINSGKRVEQLSDRVIQVPVHFL
ncbi:MAG: ATP-binding protein [Myxococcota bacterium]|nr:ATP-binding protein [Myxococcota bacterium]